MIDKFKTPKKTIAAMKNESIIRGHNNLGSPRSGACWFFILMEGLWKEVVE